MWFNTDLNGAPLEVTDEEGAIRWSGQYGSFGEVRRQTDGFQRTAPVSALAHQPLRYAGQYADTETGLHYNLFRYYDPQVGRFTVQDPVGLTGGLNLYAYAPNPYGWVDPLGLSACALKGKYNEVDKADLPGWIKDSFTNGEYKTVKTMEDVDLYRVFGGNAKIDGSFVSTSPALNKIQAKIDSALLPEWKNTRQFEATITVPKVNNSSGR